MNNQFNINSYFTHNYGMGNKPKVSKFAITFKKILLLIIAIANMFVPKVGLVGVLVTALFAFLFIVLPILKINKEKKAADEWQENFNFRAKTWNGEFDKFFDAKIKAMDPKGTAMKKLGLDDEMLKDCADPFSIYGKKYDSYYRTDSTGYARTTK